MVGPDALNGDGLATVWGEVLGRAVRYGGDDLVAFEHRLKTGVPAWHARDLALMMRRYQVDGAIATSGDVAATAEVLGRPPRSYRAFASESAARWATA